MAVVISRMPTENIIVLNRKVLPGERIGDYLRAIQPRNCLVDSGCQLVVGRSVTEAREFEFTEEVNPWSMTTLVDLDKNIRLLVGVFRIFLVGTAALRMNRW
jgi:hypothetical protein